MKYMPIVAILTGLFEISFAIFFLPIVKKSKKPNLNVLLMILFLLSSYQLLEAYNCSFNNVPILVRLSFLFITWLPALGIYFSYLSSPNKNIIFRITSYLFLALALYFSFWFMIYGNTAVIKVCKSFIAVYSNRFPMYKFYGAYYQIGLLFMVTFSVINITKEENYNNRLIIQDFILGSLLFIIPSLVITSLFSSYRGAIPSVMCHLALFLGIFIVKTLSREKKLVKKYEIK